MNNSSQAFVLTGVILISIAIVGMATYIFSNTSSMVESTTSQMDAMMAQTANSTVKQYSGPRVRGSTVKELIEYVEVLNNNDTFPVDLTISGVNEDDIISNMYYSVELYDNNYDGYYDFITITSNS